MDIINYVLGSVFVIGAGWSGLQIAAELKNTYKCENIIVFEKQAEMIRRKGSSASLSRAISAQIAFVPDRVRHSSCADALSPVPDPPGGRFPVPAARLSRAEPAGLWPEPSDRQPPASRP